MNLLETLTALTLQAELLIMCARIGYSPPLI
jgi:hypothetical protein